MEPSALEMEEAAMFTDMGIELVGCATLVDARATSGPRATGG